MAEQKEYKYYAFISYSRKNSKVAAYFHRRLEHFRIPVKYVSEENRPPKQKFLRPVFRDRRDLEANENSFTDDIKKALENSRYLIVLCSPESAQSKWVDEEIKYFLETHNNNYRLIVPVVLSGCPGCANETECLPLSLRLEEITSRNLPSMIPDEGEDEKTGWLSGVVQSMSYMLKVNRERIRATVDAERVRLAKIYSFIGIASAMIFAGLACWAIKAEQVAELNKVKAEENERLAKKNAQEAEMSAIKAENERRIAVGTLDFIVDTFSKGDPLNAGQGNVRIVDALKMKVPDIYKLEPLELRADIQCHIGSLFYNNGMFEEATNLLFSAVELNKKMRPNSNNMAYSLYCMSWCYADINDIAKAMDCAKQSLRIYESEVKKDEFKISQACNAIGVFSMRKGDLKVAREHLNRSLLIKERVLGYKNVGTAIVYVNLGFLYSKQRLYDLAQKAFKKAVEIYRANGEQGKLGLVKSLRGLGLTYKRTKDYDTAVKYFTEAYDECVQNYEKKSFLMMNLCLDIGRTYILMGKLGSAQEFLKKALGLFDKISTQQSEVALDDIRSEIEKSLKSVNYRLKSTK